MDGYDLVKYIHVLAAITAVVDTASTGSSPCRLSARFRRPRYTRSGYPVALYSRIWTLPVVRLSRR